jgi:hypothetical protein
MLTGLQGRMTMRSTTTQESHNWAVYLTKSIPAKLVGFIEDSPDERTATARAVKEYRVPKDEHGRQIAQRRDCHVVSLRSLRLSQTPRKSGMMASHARATPGWCFCGQSW